MVADFKDEMEKQGRNGRPTDSDVSRLFTYWSVDRRKTVHWYKFLITLKKITTVKSSLAVCNDIYCS